MLIDQLLKKRPDVMLPWENENEGIKNIQQNDNALYK